MRKSITALGARPRGVAALTAVVCLCATVLAQTVIKLPKNKYTPQQDVEIGREAAAEVRKQYPIVNDEKIARYLKTIGDRLVAAALPPSKGPGDLAKPAPASGAAPESAGTPGQPLPVPSSQYREITGGKIFHASVPDNWTPLGSKSSIKVVPPNGYGPYNGQTVFTCGVEFGIIKAESRDLAQATNAWLNAVAQNNHELRAANSQQAVRISGRSALATQLLNASPLGGQERIGVYTTFLADGATLFYYLTVVQEKDAAAYRETFQRIGASIRLTEVR